MSNLKTNLTSLEALIDKANALPEAKTIQSSKTVRPSTSAQTVTPDSGYDGMAEVTVFGMPLGDMPYPSINVSSNGLITATMTYGEGYLLPGSVEKTKQLTTQAAKTITPTKSSQTAVAKNVYTTGAVSVAAIPDEYQDVSGVTATAIDVVEGKVITSSTGASVTGTNPYAKAATDTEVAEQTGYLNDLTVALDNLVGDIPLVCTVQVVWDGTSRNPPSFWDATLYSYNEEEGYHYVDLTSFTPSTEPVAVVRDSTMTIKGSYVNQISSVDGGEILSRDVDETEYYYTYTIKITAPAGSAVTIYGWCSEK